MRVSPLKFRGGGNMMNNTVGGTLHCEDQLKTTLQYDDKEKLRKKLLFLQREYVRTAQRLQRAERSDGVTQRPAVSYVKQTPPAPQGEHRKDEVGKTFLTLTPTHGQIPGGCLDTEEGEEIDMSGSSDSIKTQPPSDDADATFHGSAGQNQPSTAFQFRSRLRRQRSEIKRVDSVESKDSSKLKRTEDACLTKAIEGPLATDASQSEERHSETDSDSSSLLLTHWNTVNKKKGCIEDKKMLGASEHVGKGTALEKRDSHSKYLLLRPQNTELHNTARYSSKVANGSQCEVGIVTEQTAKDSQESTVGNSGDENKKAENDMAVKEPSLLDSCTLVEGLLFPVEYYYRTTRRMASSLSQPDIQAVILSQLSTSRPQRTRGGTRRPGNRKHESQSGGSPATAAVQSASASPCLESQDSGTPRTLESLTCSEGSDHLHVSVDAASTPPAPAARPTQSRRRRRGRPRGRSLAQGDGTAKTCLQVDQPGICSLPVSPSIQVGGGSKPPLAVHSQPTLTGTNQSVLSSTTSGHRLFPIFLMDTSKTGPFPHTKPGPTDWQPLLLPSSPLYRTPLMPRPSMPWSSAVNFEVLQDFHLPDDQFASLKLHKLRQVTQDQGLESFSAPSYNTRSSIRKYESQCSQAPFSPLSLPFSPTPTVSNSFNPSGAQCPEPLTSNVSGPMGSEHSSDKSDKSGTEVTSSGAAGLPRVLLVLEDQCEGGDTETPSSNASEFNTQAATGQQRDFATDPPGEPDVATEENLSHAPEDTGEKHSSTSSTAQHHCTEAAVDPPVDLNTESGADEPRGFPEATQSRTILALQPLAVHTQLLLSLPPTSAPRPPCSALPSSLPLPSLGLSPQGEPLTCSPSAPTLTLPPPPSPLHTLQLPPPPLSPAPPPSPGQAPAVPAELRQALHEAPLSDELVAAASVSRSESPDEQQKQRFEEKEPKMFMSCTHTLKSPAGGSLVDACCLPGASGSLCVAAAGKWAVCLWSQTSPSDWTLKHTWTFSEPVISVMAVPDTAGLICVTLGRLEIREVRMLCSATLSQTLLCQGLVRTVAALPASRVVCSLHSAAGSTLQLFPLVDGSRPIQPLQLVAPDVCVRALAPVDGLPDALIGTDQGSFLFIWNLKSGRMLQQILLPDASSNSTCVRAYSSCGVLLVLLQHQLLSSLDEGQEVGVTVRQTAWLSLLAVNPLNGRSVWASRLHPPESWSSRLCEADADPGGSVLGLSQSGCVCVWELGSRGEGFSRMVAAPQGEGWQLARWGRGGTLVTGHHNGDVTLHCRRGAPCSAGGDGQSRVLK